MTGIDADIDRAHARQLISPRSEPRHGPAEPPGTRRRAGEGPPSPQPPSRLRRRPRLLRPLFTAPISPARGPGPNRAAPARQPWWPRRTPQPSPTLTALSPWRARWAAAARCWRAHAESPCPQPNAPASTRLRARCMSWAASPPCRRPRSPASGSSGSPAATGGPQPSASAPLQPAASLPRRQRPSKPPCRPASSIRASCASTAPWPAGAPTAAGRRSRRSSAHRPCRLACPGRDAACDGSRRVDRRGRSGRRVAAHPMSAAELSPSRSAAPRTLTPPFFPGTPVREAGGPPAYSTPKIRATAERGGHKQGRGRGRRVCRRRKSGQVDIDAAGMAPKNRRRPAPMPPPWSLRPMTT